MDYNDLIQDFVDGSIEPNKEEELFLLLSNNDEMRSELKQVLAIKEAVKNDKKAYTPAPESTMKIFNTLGFQAPIPEAPIPVTPKTNIFSNLFNSKYSQGIIGGFIAAATTAIIILSLMPWNSDFNSQYSNYDNNLQNNIPYTSNFNNDNYHNNNNNNDITSSNNYGNSNPDINNSKMNSSTSNFTLKDSNAYKNTKTEKIRTIIKYVYIKNDSNTKQDNIIVSDTINEENTFVNNNGNVIIKSSQSTLANIAQLFIAKPFANERFNSNQNTIPEFGIILAPTFESGLFNEVSNSTNWAFEFSGNQAWNFPEASISPKTLQIFNNISLALTYKLNTDLFIGLEYRRETFFQEYLGLDSDGELYIYEQQPNFSTYSATVRYIPEVLQFSIIKPFSQLSIGANKAGPVGRAMLGFEIAPYPALSFILGIEGSHLRFYHNNNNFNTSKIGINFGAKFGF